MASAESPCVPPSSNEQFSTDEGEELSPLKRTIAQRQLQKRGSRRTIRPFSKNSSLEELLSSASSSSSSPTIDRSKWKVKAFRNNPELNNLRERLNPLSRAVSFARTYNDTTLQQLLNDSKEENQAFSGGLSATLLQESSVLDPEKVLLLIHQHLKYAGLKQAARVLEKERPHLRPAENQGTDDESRLQSLLKLAMKDAERVWDLSINERAQMGQLDDELEEHLNDLEMLEEEIFQKGTNMWQTNDTGPLKAENELGIQAASLNKLVETLTSEKHADQSFIKTFLMTYRTFTTPEKLLMKLIERYKVPIDQKPKDMDLEKWNMHVSSIRLRVCRVLKKWVDEYLEDELHSLRFIKALLDFLETLKRDEQVFAKIAAKVLESLNRQLTSNEPPKKKIFPEPPPEPRVPRNVFSPKLSLMDIHDEELARQLTLAEFQIFSCIKPRELLNLSWSKPKQRHRSPNVLKMIRYFNDVSTWVYSCVVQCDRLRNRARIMLKFLKLTENLHKLNNFNGMMAIMAGLNASPIYRLKHTKEEVGKSNFNTFNQLESLMDSRQSFRSYRTALRNVNPPCIPYLGVYLTDLTFIEDGNPDYVDDLINFSKRRMVYDVISKIQQFQQLPYNFHPIHQIQHYIANFPRVDETTAWTLSNQLEPKSAARSDIL